MAPRATNGVRSLSMVMEDRSLALPMDKRPPALDGTIPGDVGFDPVGFSNNPPKFWNLPAGSLKWYQEAEIMHARVAMLAVVGILFPSWYHFPGNADVGLDAYADTNPLTAMSTCPPAALWQIAFAIFCQETNRISKVIVGGAEAGEHGWGQKGAYNPFQFNYSEEEYREKQVQEIKNGRLAMFGALGMLLQAANSGKGVVDQLSGAFSFPDERAIVSGMGVLGDYFPPGL